MSSSVEKHYFLWTRKECPWCIQALELLNKKGLPSINFVMDDAPRHLLEAKRKLNWETVPIIYRVSSNGVMELVGGYTDLEKCLESENDSMQPTPS